MEKIFGSEMIFDHPLLITIENLAGDKENHLGKLNMTNLNNLNNFKHNKDNFKLCVLILNPKISIILKFEVEVVDLNKPAQKKSGRPPKRHISIL
ncbi:hypothetical protein BpHYR1_032992 [Brachionus plicatilis]|uniref:Uncharacterized protein n=1 Tax=Brachionus plicatilis TaxID=10195 RepID=A0A3M7REQ8_BRAPC|nr:hypothetical protein BpHYR1_032992 [Brachionus plicatilis]